MKVLTSNNYEIIPIDDLTNVRFYTSRDPGSLVAPHWHDAVEIILLQGGELYYTTEDHRRKIPEHSCIITSPNVIHSTLCTRPNNAIVFQIPVSFLERYIPDARFLKFDLHDPCDDPIRQTKINIFKETLEKMQTVMDFPVEGSLLRFNSLLYDAIFQLIHNFSQPQPEHQVAGRDKNLGRLKAVLEYIQAHYNEPIALADVSALAMYEPKYFCRFFKHNMGTTFLEYQNKIRISKIYDDLLSTEDPLNLILDRHGFTNYKVFRRMFAEQFQTTPGQLRKKKVSQS